MLYAKRVRYNKWVNKEIGSNGERVENTDMFSCDHPFYGEMLGFGIKDATTVIIVKENNGKILLCGTNDVIIIEEGKVSNTIIDENASHFVDNQIEFGRLVGNITNFLELKMNSKLPGDIAFIDTFKDMSCGDKWKEFMDSFELHKNATDYIITKFY